LMSGPYKPAQFDLFLAFAYLALVSLMPFAMYSITRTQESVETARATIAEYAILLALLMGLAAVLNFRNMRRGWWTLEDDERTMTWNGFLRICFVCAMTTLAFAVDLIVGPREAAVVFFTTAGASVLARLFVKNAPSAAALRIVVGPENE